MESKNKYTEQYISITENKNVAIVHVEFGSPMKNCLHYGICRVTLPAAIDTTPCSCRSMATIISLDTGLIQFIFEKKEIHDKVFEKYFQNGFFKVDDDYSIPEKILKKINFKKFIIKQGSYPILIENELLKITF